jgi:hypothetical protein
MFGTAPDIWSSEVYWSKDESLLSRKSQGNRVVIGRWGYYSNEYMVFVSQKEIIEGVNVKLEWDR